MNHVTPPQTQDAEENHALLVYAHCPEWKREKKDNNKVRKLWTTFTQRFKDNINKDSLTGEYSREQLPQKLIKLSS